ncbi:SPW repeat domain-containing protein [Halopelagius longus]|uniref:SPW repeat-containing integral membrane domain-containing protein n=1 Tax=Halopelagius longus TaxID=1236180 RepID=A0A1H1GL54_9EURY|nr:hypothetical protein [Halopelagius longus]RDI69673.1 hypothetical protein DWB78_18045 [Halopelagius longus]SDR13954.1 hypothetical protein SAMN05216278_3746 [Halopelagius longus]
MVPKVRNAWAQSLSVLVGAWLVASPRLVGYDGFAADVHHVVGVLAASVSFVALWEHVRPLRLVNALLTLPLFSAPFVVPHPPAATANALFSGALLVCLAFVRGRTSESFGGGWSSLWTGDVGDRSRDE